MTPRRYSEVTNKAASTITMRSATIVPLTMLAPDQWVATPWPPTSGAMSPDPLMVNESADGCCQVEADGTELTSVIASPVQERWGRSPRVETRSKWAVATLGVPLLDPATKYSGEVANSPIWTVWGRPASRAVPTSVQWTPSTES